MIDDPILLVLFIGVDDAAAIAVLITTASSIISLIAAVVPVVQRFIRDPELNAEHAELTADLEKSMRKRKKRITRMERTLLRMIATITLAVMMLLRRKRQRE